MGMENMFLENWGDIGRVAANTAISFILLFVFIRLTGKRTLANLSAFDFIVIIALGSTLAEMMLASIPILNGAVALIVILLFQFGMAWATKKSKPVEKVVNARPTLLYLDGVFLEAALNNELVTKDEIYAEIRGAGIYDLDQIKAIVLELNGHVTIVKKSENEQVREHSLKNAAFRKMHKRSNSNPSLGGTRNQKNLRLRRKLQRIAKQALNVPAMPEIL